MNSVSIRYNDDTLNFSFPLSGDALSADTNKILEDVFAGWNAGSHEESPAFRQSSCRSLSVGDFVRVGHQWYVCASFGWNKVTDEQVAAWFTELANVRKLRRAGGTFEEERGLRWSDKRVVESRINLGANAFA